jgi:hypothetical protein
MMEMPFSWINQLLLQVLATFGLVAMMLVLMRTTMMMNEDDCSTGEETEKTGNDECLCDQKNATQSSEEDSYNCENCEDIKNDDEYSSDQESTQQLGEHLIFVTLPLWALVKRYVC